MRKTTPKVGRFLLALALIFIFQVQTSAQTIDYFNENSQVAEITYPEGYTPYYNPYTVKLLAQMIYGEGGRTIEQKAAACYTVFWQYNTGAGSIKHILESWYYGYSSRNPVVEEYYELAMDVYIRYDMYQCGYTLEECGIVLPPDYRYFNGNGTDNTFRNHWNHQKATYWKWSLPSPY